MVMFTIGLNGGWDSEEAMICKLKEMQIAAEAIGLEVECLKKPAEGWGKPQYEGFTSTTLWKFKPPGYEEGLVLGTFNPLDHTESRLDCHVFFIDKETYYIPPAKPIQIIALSPGVILNNEYQHEDFLKLENVTYVKRGLIDFFNAVYSFCNSASKEILEHFLKSELLSRKNIQKRRKHIEECIASLPDSSVKNFFQKHLSTNRELDCELRKAYFKSLQINFFTPHPPLKKAKIALEVPLDHKV